MPIPIDQVQIIVNIPNSYRTLTDDGYRMDRFLSSSEMKQVDKRYPQVPIVFRFVLNDPFVFTGPTQAAYEAFADSVGDWEARHITPRIEIAAYVGRLSNRWAVASNSPAHYDPLDTLGPSEWVHEVHKRVSRLAGRFDAIEFDSLYGPIDSGGPDRGQEEFKTRSHQWKYLTLLRSLEGRTPGQRMIVRGEARHAALAPQVQRKQPVIRRSDQWKASDPAKFARNKGLYATEAEHLGPVHLLVDKGTSVTFTQAKSSMKKITGQGHIARLIMENKWRTKRTIDDWIS